MGNKTKKRLILVRFDKLQRLLLNQRRRVEAFRRPRVFLEFDSLIIVP